ncbi:hypothetical protein CKM354_000875700 [Cercospora kikuchii]|uniref:Uncharacterized protein n=1 Tax=Cercospora kikuchii TaxID=84275 RepID=A0A9P3CWF8_9PEZI|nr:uncharacterized protein CKM354_000875700 [Cercospora kikuchii]GIZ45598.1 hypothetical protein CKM354_000875700 [Cercospora kikuchii]
MTITTLLHDIDTDRFKLSAEATGRLSAPHHKGLSFPGHNSRSSMNLFLLLLSICSGIEGAQTWRNSAFVSMSAISPAPASLPQATSELPSLTWSLDHALNSTEIVEVDTGLLSGSHTRPNLGRRTPSTSSVVSPRDVVAGTGITSLVYSNTASSMNSSVNSDYIPMAPSSSTFGLVGTGSATGHATSSTPLHFSNSTNGAATASTSPVPSFVATNSSRTTTTSTVRSITSLGLSLNQTARGTSYRESASTGIPVVGTSIVSSNTITTGLSLSMQATGSPLPESSKTTSDTGLTSVPATQKSTQDVSPPRSTSVATTASSAILPSGSPSADATPAPTALSDTDVQAKKDEIVQKLQGTMPRLQQWIGGIEINPKPLIEEFKLVRNMTEGLLKGIPDDHKGGGCTQSLFGALRCVAASVQKAVDDLSKGVKEGLKGTLGTLNDAIKAIPNLKPEYGNDNNNDHSLKSGTGSTRPPTSSIKPSSTFESSTTQSTSENTASSATLSSSTCTHFATATNNYVTCWSTTIGSSAASKVCETSQSIISGCTVTGTTTTTSITASIEPTLCAQSGCDVCTHSVATNRPSAIPRRASLGRRDMETPDDYDSYDDFMIAQFQGSGKDLCYVLPLRPWAGDPKPGQPYILGGTSSQAFPFKSTPFSTAVQGLYGCTSLVIVSTGGVFISHIFEDPTFMDTKKRAPQYPLGMPADDAVWERDVKKAIFRGDGTEFVTNYGLARLVMDGNVFDKKTHVLLPPLIITPQPAGVLIPGSRPDDDCRYQRRIDQLRGLIRNLMDVEPKVVTYIPLLGSAQSREQMDKTARGKVLIQYDPHAKSEDREETDPKTGQTRICSYQKAGFKVWADTQQMVSHHYWEARGDQKGHQVPVQTLIYQGNVSISSVAPATALSCRIASGALSSVATISEASLTTSTIGTSSTMLSTEAVSSGSKAASRSSLATSSISTVATALSTEAASSTSPTSTTMWTTEATTTTLSTNASPTKATGAPASFQSKEPGTSCRLTTIAPVTWTTGSSVTTIAGGAACTCNNGQMVDLNTITKFDGSLEYYCAATGSSALAVSTSRMLSPTPTPTSAAHTTAPPPSTSSRSPCKVDNRGTTVCYCYFVRGVCELPPKH